MAADRLAVALAALAAAALPALAAAVAPAPPAAAAAAAPPVVVGGKAARLRTKAASTAPTLAWHDGTGWRELRVDPSREADLTPRAGGAAVVLRPVGASPKWAGAAVSPVLVDEAGRERALPGGVLLVLRAPLDEAAARAAIAAAGATPARRIDAATWLVESPPGLASLELANRLQASGRFASAQPNWWVRRALK